MNANGRMEVIRELCSFEGRLAGTDAERRAANRMAERLRAMRRPVEVEPIYVHPQVWALYAVHCALGVAGSLVSIAAPAVGFGVVLASALSLYLDLNTRMYLLRRLFFRRASQNVYSRGGRPDAPAMVVLSAHLDVARTGYVFGARARRREARIPPALRPALAPPRLMFWSLASLLPLLGARMAGLEGAALDVAQLLPTLALMLNVLLLADVQLSDAVPGANDNASGVAAVLAAAEALAADPPEHLDVCVLLTGGEECTMEGMRSFVRGRRRELDRDATHFIVLDMVGIGNLAYIEGEGLAVTYRHSQRLVQLCEAISIASAADDGDLEARRATVAIGSDALPATAAGFPAITVKCLADNGLHGLEYHTLQDTPDRIDPDVLHRTERFVLELVRQLDRDVGRRLAAR